MRTQALVFGASGYSGLELLRLIAQHRYIDLAGASSNRWEGEPLGDYAPQWPGKESFVSHDRLFDQAQSGQVAFLATHATVSHDLAPKLIQQGLQVIDVSGAFRLGSVQDVQQWYGFDHQHEDLLSAAVYGLPELFAEQYKSKSVNLIANPGCYPTATILALAPLLANNLIRFDVPIQVDGKSGVTGAGRKLADSLLYNEVAETFRPYRMTKHQHTPEIERYLSRIADCPIQLSFTPHLIPVRRGLMTSSYAQSVPGVTQNQIDELYTEYYAQKPFVRFQAENAPHPGAVQHTNFCDVTCKIDSRNGSICAVGAIDNLVKGAAGQALQNLNLIKGFNEVEGLLPQEK